MEKHIYTTFQLGVKATQNDLLIVPAGAEGKKQQSKKEKMKERRERWLTKISAIKVAREKQVELKRRKATPVCLKQAHEQAVAIETTPCWNKHMNMNLLSLVCG
ncbi:hypothetical protein C0J45_21550 [Silurus meridionalis]|nr:hypothetical protein C0J45_21550 [Silurus meridionalis]